MVSYANVARAVTLTGFWLLKQPAMELTGSFLRPPQMESSSAAKSKNDKAWRTVSEEIKRIFRTAVLHLQEKGTMKSTEAKKFLCSGRFQLPFNVKAQEFHFK